ncbi:MAG: carbohydrate kinase family protein [bacterium]|nr:carbohydrate kinase family protein [bacterium]
MFDIITFGSATQDIIVKPKQLTSLKFQKEASSNEVCFPMGSKIEVDAMDFYSGGGGTNTAATFALQGFKTAFCGTVGLDAHGQNIVNELKQLRINTGLIKRTKEKLTNHSIVISGNVQDRTVFAYRGAAELMGKQDIPWRKLKAKWLYIAPLSGELAANFEELVNFAHEHKIKVAVNPSMAQLSLPNFVQIAQKIDVLILNQEEASFLTKIPFEKEQAIFNEIDKICLGVAVMTKGGDGVTVSDGRHIFSAKPQEARIVVDTLGAGDAFGSGFVAEFIRSGNIEASIQFGMANSVGNLSQVGAKTGLLKRGQEFEKVEVKKESVQ